jgi:tRNA (cytidine/uridine-2'-O-)-methyltransferase
MPPRKADRTNLRLRCGRPATRLRNQILATLRIALYQPDIAGNTGTILRMAACLGLAVDIIEPAGFDLSDRALRRAGMDYLEMAALTRHLDFASFDAWRHGEHRRLVLLSTRAARPYTQFSFTPSDILLFGRESAGVPDAVHDTADARLLIPMPGGGRSLNVALAAAMTVGEAIRQVG